MDTALLIHPRTKQQLKQYLSEPTHALGLSGDNGAGKGYVAFNLCAQLLCINIETTKIHPYVKLLDASVEKTGIDDIRELQKFLTLTVPGSDKIKRVVILEHFDIISHEAQNALLKTLEEPPADTVIIVTYTRATQLLPTIHSRLQSIQISPVSKAQAQTYYSNVAEKEFTKAYILSGGLVGLLSALLKSQIDHPLIRAIEQSRAIISLPRHKRLGLVDKLIKNKELPVTVVLDGIYRLIEASYRHASKTKPREDLKVMTKRLSLIEKAIEDMEQNIQPKLVISRLFLEL